MKVAFVVIALRRTVGVDWRPGQVLLLGLGWGSGVELRSRGAFGVNIGSFFKVGGHSVVSLSWSWAGGTGAL